MDCHSGREFRSCVPSLSAHGHALISAAICHCTSSGTSVARFRCVTVVEQMNQMPEAKSPGPQAYMDTPRRSSAVRLKQRVPVSSYVVRFRSVAVGAGPLLKCEVLAASLYRRLCAISAAEAMQRPIQPPGLFSSKNYFPIAHSWPLHGRRWLSGLTCIVHELRVLVVLRRIYAPRGHTSQPVNQ